MMAVNPLGGAYKAQFPLQDDPATTHDNACTAILWRLEGMLRHVSRRKIAGTPVCLEQIAVLPGSSGVAGVGRARSGSPVGRQRRRCGRGRCWWTDDAECIVRLCFHAVGVSV